MSLSPNLVTLTDPRSAAAEAYRALRKQAMESNARLAEVSRQLIAVAGLIS